MTHPQNEKGRIERVQPSYTDRIEVLTLPEKINRKLANGKERQREWGRQEYLEAGMKKQP